MCGVQKANINSVGSRMIVIENKYEIGDTVYLKTDAEQQARIVICFKVYKAGEIMYELVSGTIQSSHYDFEISSEKNLINVWYFYTKR